MAEEPMTEPQQMIAGLLDALGNVQNDARRGRALVAALRGSAADIPSVQLRGLQWGKRRAEIDEHCARIDQVFAEIAAEIERDSLRLREVER